MDKRAFATLEFDKITEALRGYAASSLGKEKVGALRPSTDRSEILQWQEETSDAVSLILQCGNPPLFGIHEVKSLAHRAKLGGALSAQSLLQISEGLRVARTLIEYVEEADDSRIVDQIQGLFVQKGLEEEISSAILGPDEISDTASNTLYRIRRSLKQKQDQIKTKLNDILQKESASGRLRENLITMRGGRYVLPVRAESRRAISGVVHDQSSSGATVFVEPMAVVELNNEIRKLEVEEQDEILRILAELSQEVAEYAEEIAGNQDQLQWLDFTFAKAKYALDIGASQPIFTEDRSLDIRQARHPLLKGKVVPIDIKLGGDFNTLIITGPNTGGKTVTLKTLGLLTMMAQAGLQIPAKNRSKVAVFSNVYADIGDKQSIELSLSTFSASMSNIVSILEDADRESLVLFDELCAGTDPTEGAALAMAILDLLTKWDIRTVATTHYSELKLFALKQPGVKNASVEFDVETLSPTYRLIIGIPGRSNAFEISKRLGLHEGVLDHAQGYLDQDNVQFEDVLSSIESDRIKIEKERAEVSRMRDDYEEKFHELDKDIETWKKQSLEEVEAAKQEARDIVDEANTFAQQLIRDAKKAKAGNTQELDRMRTRMHQNVQELEGKLAPKKRRPKKTEIPDTLKVGETVEVVSMGQKGVVISEPSKSGEVQVQMGILKVNVKLRDLKRAQSDEAQKIEAQQKNLVYDKVMSDLPLEIDLRGENLDDALHRVDKYLDDAVLVGYHEVRLLHGKGTGVLRQGIKKWLKKDRRVKQAAEADYKEGGAGVTVVKLK